MKKTEEQAKTEVEFDPDTFEFKTLKDFEVYNANVRKANRAMLSRDKNSKLYPIKVPDESFHRKIKVKFQRFDQPQNVLKVRLRTKEIDWKGQLKPNGIYDLPLPVVKFLNKLAVPIFAEVKVEDGGPTKTETRQVGEQNRFSCQVMDMVD